MNRPMPTKRVLVVDDNEHVAKIMGEFLSPAYNVELATNVDIALEAIRMKVPDLILLDIHMPGTDGLTMLGSLRQLGIRVPVIIMTGYDSPEAAAEAKRTGATSYLVKPVDLRQLDKVISKVVGAPRL